MENEINLNTPQIKPKKSRKKLTIILLIVLLLAGAAFAGWKWHGQIEEYKNNQNNADRQVQALEDELNKLKQSGSSEKGSLKSYKLQSQKITFTYPEDWTVETGNLTNLGQEFPVEQLYVTSPDKKLKIELRSGIDGLGGGCETENQSLEKTLAVVGMNSYKVSQAVSFVERVVYDKESGKYYAGYGVANSSGQKVGEEQVCPHLSYMVAEAPKANSGVSFGSGYTVLEGGLSFSTLQQAQAFFESPNYKAAKTIVQSLTTN